MLKIQLSNVLYTERCSK